MNQPLRVSVCVGVMMLATAVAVHAGARARGSAAGVATTTFVSLRTGSATPPLLSPITDRRPGLHLFRDAAFPTDPPPQRHVPEHPRESRSDGFHRETVLLGRARAESSAPRSYGPGEAGPLTAAKSLEWAATTDAPALPLPTEQAAAAAGGGGPLALSEWVTVGVASLAVLVPLVCFASRLRESRWLRRRLAEADRLRRFSLVFESTCHGVILTDGAGRALEVNTALLKLLRREAAELLGQVWVPCIQHPDSPPETYARVYEALRHRTGCDLETLARRSDGTGFWCRIEMRPIEGTGGGHVVLLSDIDPSRRAEEILQAERRLLSSILAAAPVGVLAFDGIEGPDGHIQDFRIRLANPLAGKIAGKTIGALEGSLVSDLFPGFFSSGFFQRLCTCVEEGTPVAMELLHHRNDGSAWLHGTAVPLGRGCVLCLADITAVKRTEEKFRAIFEQSTFACALLDATGIIECNESFLRLFRLSHAREAIHRQLWSFCPERQADGSDSSEIYSALREQAFRSGHAIHTWRHLRADGTSFEAQLSLTPITFGGSSLLLGFWIDLTAELEARRQADENEERLHLAVESAEVIVWEWDSIRGALHIPAGQPCSLHLTLEDVRAAVRGWEAAWRAADSATGDGTRTVHESEHELPASGAPGRWLLLRGRATAWDDTGCAVRMCGTLTDITARRHAEDELRYARDRAEEADRAKSRFLAMMSHEIRTPMNGVIGLLELLASTPLNAEQQEYVQTILASAGTLMTVLNDVLDFSRIASDQLRLETAPFDVRRAFEDTLALHGEAAAARGLELWLNIAPDTPCQLVGDVTRLRQVVGNLVANAVKFTHEGGVDIAVRGRPLPGNAYELSVRVSDTGIGIAPDRIPRLFQPFVQADESMTRRFGGTGLGLAISRRLVQMMHGSITVDSEPGRGSTFRFHVVLGTVQDEPERNTPVLVDRTWAVVTANPKAAASLESIFQHNGGRLLMVDGSIPPQAQGLLVDVPARGTPPTVPDTHLPLVRIQWSRSGGPGSIVKPVRARQVLAAVLACQPSARHEPLPAPSPLAGQRVLVAEDDDACLRFTEILFRRLGAQVATVRDGHAAVETFSTQRPDIVLLDAHMPVLDGPSAARAIRAIEAATPSPRGPALLIALTGDTAPEDRDRLLAAGIDLHWVKPVSVERITETLLQKGTERHA